MKHKVRLNERQLHNVIKTAVKRILREQEELDDDPASWGGIDDYPNAPSAEEQWDDYRKIQGMDDKYMPFDEWKEKRSDFKITPQYYSDGDYYLDHHGINAFQQDRHGKESMYAMEPTSDFARYNPTYNGYKSVDPNNPSIDGDDSLPDKYLNETIKRALRKILRENKTDGMHGHYEASQDFDPCYFSNDTRVHAKDYVNGGANSYHAERDSKKMEKNRKKMNETQLRDYNKIDDYLSYLGGVKVSRFYSDEDNLVISVLGNNPKKKQQVKEIMHNYGYSLYDMGANGDSMMMTFKKNK